MKICRIFILLTLYFYLGCTSVSPERTGYGRDNMSDPGYNRTEVHPGAYTMNAFYLQPDPVDRPNSPNEPDFFFKECELNGDDYYYSKSAYFCDYP